MVRYLPQGWLEGVQSPGNEAWEATAVTWLLDLVLEYRQYATACRHLAVLASIVHHGPWRLWNGLYVMKISLDQGSERFDR